MSTITKEFTKEQLIEKLQHRIAVAGKYPDLEEAQLDAAIFKIALASIEAEPVAWLLSGGGAKNIVSFDSGNAYVDPLREVTPLYTAPPAPVAPDEMTPQQASRSYGGEVRGYRDGWNACRAAMLKHSEPFIVTSDHRMMEMPQVEAINAVTAMLQGANGNSPVIPDGWVACVERMPSAGEQVLAYRPDAPESNDPLIKMATYVGGSAHGHGFDCYCKPTYWMPLPAAPQQEAVSSALEHGMARYSGAMQKLADGGD